MPEVLQRLVEPKVRVAPRLGSIAAREPAVAITHDHRAPHRGWHDRRPPADVQGLGASGYHHAHHRGVARDALRGLGAHRTDVVELAHRGGSVLNAGRLRGLAYQSVGSIMALTHP
jgi:hypothetical protein